MLEAVTARRRRFAQGCVTRHSSSLLPVRFGFAPVCCALASKGLSESYLKRGVVSIREHPFR